MSGTLGAIATAITAAATAALDADAPYQPVSLGNFVFDGFEVPEMVSWGGAHKMVVHKFIGGTRVIDTLGPDDADITWSGVFLSIDASQRADELNEMRRAGSLLELIFSDRYYLVVISDFSAEMRRLSHVPYKITCTILTDLSDTIPDYIPAIQAVSDDINYLVAFVVADALAGAQDAVIGISGLLIPIVALSIGAAATTALGLALTAATGLINTAAAIASGQIGALAAAAVTTGILLGTTSAIAAVGALQTAAEATAAAASAVVLGSYVGRAAINVALA